MKRRMAQAVVLLALAVAGRVGAEEARVRKNIDALSAPELAAYEHAIEVVMARRDAQDNYEYYADLHNVFSSNPPHGCEHANDLFFPWHRYHLYTFEQALRAADPDHPSLSTKNVTIPYWDWSRPPSGERYARAFERPGSPLGSEFRNTGATSPLFDAPYLEALIENNPDWNEYAGGSKTDGPFYGAFEQPAHNDMHGTYIGGDMGDPRMAAYDPIYWSYHAFIDLQWSRWQERYDVAPTCLDCVLRGFRGDPKTSAVVKIETLGYRYDVPPAPVRAAATAAAPHERRPRTIALRSSVPAAERTVAAWGGVGAVHLRYHASGSGLRPCAPVAARCPGAGHGVVHDLRLRPPGRSVGERRDADHQPGGPLLLLEGPCGPRGGDVGFHRRHGRAAARRPGPGGREVAADARGIADRSTAHVRRAPVALALTGAPAGARGAVPLRRPPVGRWRPDGRRFHGGRTSWPLTASSSSSCTSVR